MAGKHDQDAARLSQKKLQEQLGHPITNCHTHHPPALGPININTVTAVRKKAARHAGLYDGRHQVDVIARIHCTGKRSTTDPDSLLQPRAVNCYSQ